MLIMNKKNIMGFTHEQLLTLLGYCKIVRKTPRAHFTYIHKTLRTYSRKASIIDLTKKAYERQVITGPFLVTNGGIDVKMIFREKNTRELYQKAKEDKDTTLVMELEGGGLTLLHFKYGANTLQYTDAILPAMHRQPDPCVSDLVIKEKGMLERDNYPHGWDELDWKVYRFLNNVRRNFTDVAQNLGISITTVSKRYKKIMKQSKSLICFFPNGIRNYNYQVVTFKTEYEKGIVSALKSLNQTTYVYKAYNTMILVLSLPLNSQSVNKSTRKFKELEENGLIHDLGVSTPFRWHNVF